MCKAHGILTILVTYSTAVNTIRYLFKFAVDRLLYARFGKSLMLEVIRGSM